jgi:hypothetical protein
VHLEAHAVVERGDHAELGAGVEDGVRGELGDEQGGGVRELGAVPPGHELGHAPPGLRDALGARREHDLV